jgi:SAM-dependent methyltransferase
MNGLKRSLELFSAFRREGTDPAAFYRLLAEDTVREASRYSEPAGARILDVGGASGYVADAFRGVGAWAATAEYDAGQMREHGRRLLNGLGGDGCALPVRSNSVDICHSSNVLEHVRSPERMLAEMVRVVRPGGIVYVTFTNWLSPWGGHETSPWHYFGGEWSAKRFAQRHGREPKNRFGVTLFPLSVATVLQWARACPDAVLLEAFPRYYPRWTKDLVRIPALRELLTWNLVIVMQKNRGRLDSWLASADQTSA